MYGLVNKAIEQMVCREHGAAVWAEIFAAARLPVAGFVSTTQYPDEHTYALVAAASRVLAIAPDALLRAFGEFWVLHTALESYGPLMRALGRSAPEFLQRLPDLHARVNLAYPELRPPEFECTDVRANSLLLHYRTPRPSGLEPFVEGLVVGIGRLYDVDLAVARRADRGAGDDHSVFEIRWATEASRAA